MTKEKRRHWDREAARTEKRIADYWTDIGKREAFLNAGFYGSFVMQFAKRYAAMRLREAKNTTKKPRRSA